MSKRRATGQLQPSSASKRLEGVAGDRACLFVSKLKSLNQQFAEWVAKQAASCNTQLWVDGTRHYEEYVTALLEEFKDVLGDDAKLPSQRDVSTPVPDTMFGTPRVAAASGGRDKSAAAPATGGSTGRKSVTWADNSTAATPAPAAAATPAAAAGAAANGTPFTLNTFNAGHTPAPAGFGRFVADTPGGSTMATPQFKLPPSTAGTPADGSGTAGKTPVAATGGFSSFGTGGGFGTPVAAAADDRPAAAGTSSKAPVVSFGTPAVGTTGLGPDAAMPKFAGFGTPAVAAAAGAGAARDKGGSGGDAAGTSSTPAAGGFFGFGSNSSSTDADKGSAGAAGANGDKAAAAPAGGFSFGVPQNSGAAAAGGGAQGSSPMFAFASGSNNSSSSAAAAGGSDKAPVISFGVKPSSDNAAAGAAAPAAAGGFSFGVPSSAAAGGSSAGAAAGGSTPPTFSFGAGAGTGTTPSFGATPGFGGTPSFGATPVGFGATPAAGASANGTPASFGFFPSTAGAAGGADAAGGEGDADGDDADAEQAEKTVVQRDASWDVLWDKVSVLYTKKRKEDGNTSWESLGKGTTSIRRPVGQEGAGVYIVFTMEGQGKQKVMHKILASDKCSDVPGKPRWTGMTLVNVVHGFRTPEGGGNQPEPYIDHVRQPNLIRFATEDDKKKFEELVEQYKPSA